MLVALKITQHLLSLLKWVVVNPCFESVGFDAAVSEREHSRDSCASSCANTAWNLRGADFVPQPCALCSGEHTVPSHSLLPTTGTQVGHGPA